MKVLYLIGLFFLVSMVECSLPRSGREYDFAREFEAQFYPPVGGEPNFNQNAQYKRDAQIRNELYELQDELEDVQQQQRILKEREKLIKLRLDQVSRRVNAVEDGFTSEDPEAYLYYVPLPVRKSQLQKKDPKGKQVMDGEKMIPTHYRTPSQNYKFPPARPPPNEPLPPIPQTTIPVYINKKAAASTNSLNRFKNNFWSPFKKKD